MGYRPKNFPDSSTPLFEPKRERKGNYLPFMWQRYKQRKKQTNFIIIFLPKMMFFDLR